MSEDIARRHRKDLTPDQADKMQEIQEAINGTWALMEELVPDGREKALAKTNLEQASMWAVRSVTA